MTSGTDDLGADVPLGRPVRRVVSLVPSLTESVAVTARDLLVGATDWCSHPADLDVARVRGTKNPNVSAILALRPDLVLANKEENRRRDVERLRAAGIAVWVTDVTTVDAALDSLHRVFTVALGLTEPDWLTRARTGWAPSPEQPGLTAVVPVWRDPWMVAGPDTFTADVLRHLGVHVLVPASSAATASPERYPHADVHRLRELGPDVVVLPDEPYRFTADDGPEMFGGHRVVMVSGRALTWYGPSLADARYRLTDAIRGR